jgi:hypothetical protein
MTYNFASGSKVMVRKRWRVVQHLMLAIFCFVACNLAVAQQAQPEPVPNAPAQSEPTQTSQSANPIQSGVSLFKLLQQKSVVFPDLATGQGRLSSREKFKLAANNSVAVSTIGSALIGSAYGQAIDSPSGYEQGAEGYAKRFGADMARSASENLFSTYLLATAFRQDPRFFVKRNLSFGQSVKYAAVRILITSGDDGDRQVNYSGLLGPLMGEGLANTYYPDENRTVGDTFTRYASDLGWRFGGNLLRQYWPTINRRLRLVPQP